MAKRKKCSFGPNQKIRIIIDGITLMMRVKDVSKIVCGHMDQAEAIHQLIDRLREKGYCGGAETVSGYQIQVDAL